MYKTVVYSEQDGEQIVKEYEKYLHRSVLR